MRPLAARARRLLYAPIAKALAFSTSGGARSAPGLLHHHHLRAEDGSSVVSYDRASDLQERLRGEILSWKALSEDEASTDVPRPNLISFESTPTFTLGRRQEALPAEHASRLQQPLSVSLLDRKRAAIRGATLAPQVRKTNRGGLTTYHGPGQLVFWPVLDMHSPLYPRFGVASYAAHLEATTQRLLAAFGIRTYTSRDEPGVWVATTEGAERKIAALGVHHRRYVTALGIALNVDVPVTGGEDVNPWARFVPCGLDGKLVTSVAAETKGRREAWDLTELAGRWADMFEEGLRDPSRRVFGDGTEQRHRA